MSNLKNLRFGIKILHRNDTDQSFSVNKIFSEAKTGDGAFCYCLGGNLGATLSETDRQSLIALGWSGDNHGNWEINWGNSK